MASSPDSLVEPIQMGRDLRKEHHRRCIPVTNRDTDYVDLALAPWQERVVRDSVTATDLPHVRSDEVFTDIPRCGG